MSGKFRTGSVQLSADGVGGNSSFVSRQIAVVFSGKKGTREASEENEAKGTKSKKKTSEQEREWENSAQPHLHQPLQELPSLSPLRQQVFLSKSDKLAQTRQNISLGLIFGNFLAGFCPFLRGSTFWPVQRFASYKAGRAIREKPLLSWSGSGRQCERSLSRQMKEGRKASEEAMPLASLP